MDEPTWKTLIYIGLGLIWLSVIMRAILRPHREPASRLAWVMLIAGLPIIGVLAYILLGETNIGRRRVAREREALEHLPPMPSPLVDNEAWLKPKYPGRCAPLFQLGKTINGFAPVGGNTGQLMADSNTGIDNIVADMDTASVHIHLLFYIWLGDNNGLKVVAALKPAASTTPVNSSRVGVQAPVPWAIENTSSVAAIAPPNAARSTTTLESPRSIASNAATAAPPEVPRM